MLHSNLSTRPFYNERLVHLALGLLVVAAVALSAWDLREAFVLSRRQAQLQQRVGQAEAQARALRTEAARVRGSINPHELAVTTAAAREANEVIERRVFSWTEVLNQFEATLPGDVRIAAIRPRVEKDGSVTISVSVLARGVEGVNTFIEQLEEQDTFSNVLSREEFVDEDGLLRATIEGRYRASQPAGAQGGRP